MNHAKLLAWGGMFAAFVQFVGLLLAEAGWHHGLALAGAAPGVMFAINFIVAVKK